ncbi:MAG: rhomboid family intramembrane serine protease [Spirochaetes bacterium]|jgi:membrane associated rhomboid family serine protease|nr:rhomboid family intramembrane serine protease [Spirochaetota bacterium]
MIGTAMLAGLRERPPYLTLALVATVLVTTVPQFFLPDIYDTLTGTLFGLVVPHYLTLPLFSHSPTILVPHLLGNLAVLALFGGLSEIVLGGRRFAMLTLIAAVVSLAFSYLRGLSEVHGVSGIGWAFHVPALLALIVIVEEQRAGRLVATGRPFRDPVLWVYAVFYLFDFLALPLLEVLVLGRRFFENFGQVQHLAAVVTAVPFVLVWRRMIEDRAAWLCAGSVPQNADEGTAQGAETDRRGHHRPAPGPPDPARLEPDRPGPRPRRRWSLPQALVLALLVVNLAGTVDAAVLSARAGGSDTAGYTVTPAPGTPPGEVGTVITVALSEDATTRDVNVRRRSIWYQREPAPRVDYRWLNPRELTVVLSRPLGPAEALALEFDVYRAGPRGVRIPVTVEFAYGKGR